MNPDDGRTMVHYVGMVGGMTKGRWQLFILFLNDQSNFVSLTFKAIHIKKTWIYWVAFTPHYITAPTLMMNECCQSSSPQPFHFNEAVHLSNKNTM